MLPAFLATFLFALSAVSANQTARMLGGVTANFYRISLATVLLATWSHSVGAGWGGNAFPWFLISGGLGFGLGDLALYQTLPRLGSRLSILLVHCLAAPFAALVEWSWLGTSLSPLQISASVTVLFGVSLALAPSQHLAVPRRTLLIGILFGVLAAVGQGSGAVLSRKAYAVASAASEPIDGLSAAYQRILAGWGLAAVSYAIARRSERTPNILTGRPSSPRARWQSAIPWIVLNVLAGPTLGVGCYQWALATHPTGVVLPIVATTPIIVIPFARWIEGERPSLRSLVGGAIAVMGAVILASGGRLWLWLWSGAVP